MSLLTFGKAFHEKIKEFLYALIDFLTSVQYIAKNHPAVSHMKRDSRCRSFFIFGEITAAHIGGTTVLQHFFHNIIAVGQYGDVKITPLKPVFPGSTDIKKLILIILYEAKPLQIFRLYTLFFEA